MSLIARISKVISDNNLTAAEFAKKVGIPKQSVTNWKNGSRPVPDKILILIVREFPEVDARWLITGEERPGKKNVVDFLIEQIEEKDRTITKLLENGK
jgi:transcriptional regulator with XRE-family HTH domain